MVLRYEVGGTPEDNILDPDTRAAPQIKLGGIQHRVVVHEGEFVADTSAPQRVDSSDLENAREGILGTARTSGGFPTTEIRPDTIVKVHGMEVTVDIAAKLGYLGRDSRGDYFERAGGGPEEAPKGAPGDHQNASPEKPKKPEKPKEPAEPEADPLPDATQQELYEMHSKAGGFVEESAVKVMEGKLTQADVDGLAEALEVSPDEARQRIDNLYADHFGQFISYVAKVDPDIDIQDLVAWVRAEVPEGERIRVMQEHFTTGDAKVYSSLLKQYRQTNVPAKTVERLTSKGYSFRQDPLRGVWLVVDPDGKEMAVEAARRIGIM